MKRSALKVSRWLSALAVAGMLLSPTQGLAASPDSIASGDIKEADGTTGQDTNSGSGIKSGHIQSGAVATEKIADGAVTNVKIADRAISTSKIGAGAVAADNIADGAITTTKIEVSAVSTGNIADGAVTDAKISGTISTSKLSVGTMAGTVAAGDHNHDSMYQKKPERVLVVAKSGGDYSSLSAALSAAAAMAPYVTVKVMPGLYENEGTITLNGKSNISIIGESRDSVIVKDFILDIYYSSNITVSGITFENTDSDIVDIEWSTGVTINSSIFKGGNSYGSGAIKIGTYGTEGCNNIVFKNNIVEAPVYYAITFGGNTATFDSNVIKGGQLYLSWIANEVEVTNNNFITGPINPIDNSLNSISLYGRNIRITGNTIKGAPNCGVSVSYSSDIYVANNVITSCRNGIIAEASTGFVEHNKVVGNTYDMYTFGGNMRIFYNIFDAVYNSGSIYRYNVDSNGNDKP